MKIRTAIKTHQDQAELDQPLGELGRAMRLAKLGEEVGEVNQAYIGYLGANKRKGQTHDQFDISKELCDVAITALVALSDWTDRDPIEMLTSQLDQVARRCADEGS